MKRILAALAALSLSACTGMTPDGNTSINGNWSGSSSATANQSGGIIVGPVAITGDASLLESGDLIAGQLKARGGGGTMDMNLTGSKSGANVTLIATPTGCNAVTLTGIVVTDGIALNGGSASVNCGSNGVGVVTWQSFKLARKP